MSSDSQNPFHVAITAPEPQEQQPLTQTSHEEPGISESLFDNILLDLPEMGDLPDIFGGSPSINDLGSNFYLPELTQNSLDLNQGHALAEPLPVVSEEQSNVYPVAFSPPTPFIAINSPTQQVQEPSDVETPRVNSIVPYSKPTSTTNKGPRTITVISPSKPLNDPASILVEFYFKETAQLFSCYDSSMNPFRTAVSRLWNSSPLLYKTLSSMAAASLVDDFPQLGILGKQLRFEAIQMLDKNMGSELDSLLAMLMLGGSASWHDSRDLGLRFFNRIRRKLASMTSSKFDQHGVDYQFFHHAITYWEMLLSYVAENDELESNPDKALVPAGCMSLNFVPHPWTGFARDTQNAVQKVGRLIRRQRKLAFSRRFTSLAHIKQLERDMATASELETFLCTQSYPLETAVLDPDDRNTPVWHLLSLAEAYRSTGLIQLYHIFPDLLDRRLARDGLLPELHEDDDGSESSASLRQLRNDWLTAYAVQVLNLMKSIPLESGTRDFQPFILVALSSELRTPPAPKSPPRTGPEAGTAEYMAGLTSQTIEVSRMRHFIKSRLNSFLHILPPKPIHVCLNIVNTTWKMMDERAEVAAESVKSRRGSCEVPEEVYWMDVMIENGWETTMA